MEDEKSSTASPPPLPLSEPPPRDVTIRHDVTGGLPDITVLQEDTEVAQILHEPTEDTLSRLRLQADLQVKDTRKPQHLKPGEVRHKRRRSPVTVQEWVASLPLPHLMARNELHQEDATGVKKAASKRHSSSHQHNLLHQGEDDENKQEPTFQSSASLKSPSLLLKAQSLSKDPRDSWNHQSGSSEYQLGDGENDHVDPQQQEPLIPLLTFSDTVLNNEEKNTICPPKGDTKGLSVASENGEGQVSSFRRLSAAFEQMEEEEMEKARDGETDDEDVLIDDELSEASRQPSSSFGPPDIDNENMADERTDIIQLLDEDNLKLGAEASQQFGVNGLATSQHPLRSVSLEARRRLLLQSHEQHTSFQSDMSAKTVSSVDSVLLSRNVDPAELLMDLGFGGPPTSSLARIPARFFSKSQAKGISVEDFLLRQEELVEKFDSGFSGYRGLSGSSSTRPSKLVEKIIDKIRMQDRLFRRQLTGLSLSSAVYAGQHNGFKGHNNNNGRAVSAFANVVNQVVRQNQHSSKAGLRGARAFRAAAHSVLSPANRQFMADQAERADRLAMERAKKRLVLGGQTFSVDEDDLSVVDEELEYDAELNKVDTSNKIMEPVLDPVDELAELRDPGAAAASRKHRRSLTKRDSTMSMNSSCSVDSDWSDEELEELEKMFGDINQKSTSMAVTDPADGSSLGSPSKDSDDGNSLTSRWRHLKKSRRMAMARLQYQKGAAATRRANVLSSTSSMTSEEIDEEANRAGLIYSRLSSAPEQGASAKEQKLPQRQLSEPVVDTTEQVDQHQLFMDVQQLAVARGDHRVPRRFSHQKMRY